MENNMEKSTKVVITLAVIAIALLLVIVFSPFKIISAGEIGVVLRLGEVNRIMLPGIHWKTPLVEAVEVMDVTTQKEEVKSSAASKDLQSVSSVIAVNYNLDPQKVDVLWSQFQGDHKRRVIDPSVQESVKAATAKYTAEELITKREAVKDEILGNLKERLSQSNIIVSNVSIVDFDFSSSFNASIEAKVKAVQDALKAENDLKRIQFEAEQAVATAEGKARAIRLESDAANNPRYVELKKLEVQLEYAKKWSGVLPVNVYGSAPIPFLNVGN